MFKSTFQAPFQNPFPSEGDILAEDWWLSGGISAGDCVAAYQAKGAASLAASYSNLNNPGTDDALISGAPSWNSITGWSFAGTQRVYAPVTINGESMTFLVSLSGALGFAISSANSFNLRLQPNGVPNVYYRNFRDVRIAPVLSGDGVLGIAGPSCYRNGALDGTLNPSGAPNITNVYIGNHGNGSQPYQGNIYSFALYNVILAEPQVLAVTSAMNLL